MSKSYKNYNKKVAATSAPAAVEVPAIPQPPSWLSKYALLLIIALTLIIYGHSAFNSGFVEWYHDDPINLIENENIRSFSGENIKKYFTEFYYNMYCPVKMVVHAMEYSLWELNPTGYHVVSLLMHCTNILLVFYLVFLLLGSRTGAYLAALIFAVHPMAVETVAWVSARGDAQYTLFYLSALVCYCKYLKLNPLQKHTYKYLLLTFLFFLLAVLSKSSAVTLPIVLVLIDWYKGGKWWSRQQIAKKVPFFLLSIVLGIVTIKGRQEVGGLPLLWFLDVEGGILQVLYSTPFYLVKFIAPFNLSPHYPHPLSFSGALDVAYYLMPIVLMGVILLLVLCKKHRKVLLFAMGFYFIAIFFTLQIVPMGDSICNDRYAYLPFVGFCLILAYTYQQLAEKYKKTTVTVVICVAFAFAFSANDMSKIWKSDLALCNQYQQSYPNYSEPYAMIAKCYLGSNQPDMALEYAIKGTKVKHLGCRINGDTYVIAANILVNQNRLDESLRYFNTFLKINPNKDGYYYSAYLRKVRVLAMQNKMEECESLLSVFDEVSLQKDAPAFFYDLVTEKAFVAFHTGNFAVAIQKLIDGERVQPLQCNELEMRCAAYLKLGRKQDAQNDYHRLLEIAPDGEEVKKMAGIF
ncbi:O-GlcNAc transferase [Bacteroidia bacterium]|nr:O-GlcNAc transferase [Bacteroidia bacterium]